MKTALLISLALTVLVALLLSDRWLSDEADKRIKARNADFEQNYEYNELDWSGNSTQNCKKNTEFYIYTYQTCFLMQANRGGPDDWHASYYYHKPRAKTSLTRLFMSSKYYFNELALGEALEIVKYKE